MSLASVWVDQSIFQVSSQHPKFSGSVAILMSIIVVLAGEAKDPRRTIPRAFRTIIIRLLIFCVGGALCVGVGQQTQLE